MTYTLTNMYMSERNEEFGSLTEAYDAYDATEGIGWLVKDEDGKVVYREEDRYYTVDEDGDERTVSA